MKQKIVEVGDFAEMLDGSFGEYGVKKGDIIYVAGDALVSTDKDDPYAMRKIFVGAFTKEGHIDTKTSPFTVDGKRLRPVGEGKQKKLDAMRDEDFSKGAVESDVS